MFRLFLFLLVVLGMGWAFAWVADNPGNVVLEWDWLNQQLKDENGEVRGNQVVIPLARAIAILIGIVVVLMLVIGFFRGVINAPSILSHFFDNRRRDRGMKALSQGLIAASSGDVDAARRLAKESGRFLKNEPLVALLSTQTALLEGKRDEARTNFRAMLEDDSTKMVALRGLFLEAERQDSPEAARHYAEEAVRLAPSLPWAGTAKLRYQAADGSWDDALRTLEANRSAGLVEKVVAKRQRAVLLTAKAITEEQANPDGTRKLAREAHKLAKDLVPAATVFARAATRLGDISGATKVLEATWKLSPHPDLADAYSTVRAGDSVKDRLKRAKRLAGLSAGHPESAFALAVAAIDATEWAMAREALEPVLTTRPTERACLLMAEIEEGEHGDKGRMRDWLSRAVRAPADPAWTADGQVSEEWLPMSPVTGEIDAFEWKVPVEQLGDDHAPVMTLEELKAEAQQPLQEEMQQEEKKEAETIEATEMVEEAELVEETAEAKTEPEPEDVEEKVVEITSKKDEPKAEPVAESKDLDAEEAEKSAEKTVEEAIEASDNTVKFPLERRPDDPGVRPEDAKSKKGGTFF